MIVIIDCNIWITLTLNKQLDLLANLSDNGSTIATCDLLREEIEAVLHRPKIAKHLAGDIIAKVMEFHDLITTAYKLGEITSVTTDIKDGYLFALANKAKADYLITGDKLLLKVLRYKNTEVINLAAFKLL